MRKILPRFVLVVVLTLMVAAYAWAEGPTTSPAPASIPAFGPISYFQDHCSRCHGAYGSAYLPELIGRHSDEELRRIIDDMAYGPAQAPLEGDQLEAVVAYHRALIRNEPFVYRIAADRGEVTPGTMVTIETEAGSTPAHVDDHTWHAPSVPAGAAIVVEKDGERITLPSGAPSSHRQPLARP